MTAEGLLAALIQPMREHLDKLSGTDSAASAAADSFTRATGQLTDIGGRHDAAARTALGTWYGQQAGQFQDRSAKVATLTTSLADNCTTASQVATHAVQAVTQGRTTISQLIDEFLAWAKPRLAGADAALAGGNGGAYAQVCAEVRASADDYATKSARTLQSVRDQLSPLVVQLAPLQQVDPGAMTLMGNQLGPSIDTGTSASSVALGTGGGSAAATIPHPGQAPAAAPGGHTDFGGGGGGGYGGGGGGGGQTAVGPHLPEAIPPQPGSGVGVNLPDGSSATAPNDIAAQAVRHAMTALGTPYVWGASNPPAGTDCSGLTSWAYGLAGLQLPRHSAAQAMGASVSPANIMPGDLIVWDGHVAMAIGNGQLIEAGDPVQTNPIRTQNCGDPFLGFYRPTG